MVYHGIICGNNSNCNAPRAGHLCPGTLRRLREEKDLFAVTFLLFALFDYLGQTGVEADTLAFLNIIAVLAALGGMYLVIQER